MIRKLLSIQALVGLLIAFAGAGGATLALTTSPAAAGPLPYTVYVGYGDNAHKTAGFPVPWFGDKGVTWEGCSGGCKTYDAGAVRVVDTGDARGITVNSVSVKIGACVFSSSTGMAWGTSVPVGFEGSAIYTQTKSGGSGGCPGDGTMDTSDVQNYPVPPGTCTNDDSKPTVTVTATDSSGTKTTTTYTDSGQVLNTGGVDAASCGKHTEATQWTPIGTAPCAAGATLTLSPASQTLPVSTTATVTADLSSCGTQLPGATVHFSDTAGPNIGTTGSGPSVTNASGDGGFSYSSVHTGTDTLQASVSTVVGPINSNTVTVTWTASFLASGAFVISDTHDALGTNVTFWGAHWSRDDVPSGGSDPSSFKGFADSTSTNPPSCGGTWSTRTGNSSHPPAAPLPQYMAVIVTSSDSQSGSHDSGNIVHIVVVKTNLGYAPNPGHAGTGTVVGEVC